ncbi:nucleolar complex protein 2 homolog isoform X1 [Osmia bicornis bicornis]|uniref:nucleolar complex protein 2 homolog isoform X1 n=1 Tax=Osmia bicornis bicornis TaxID=1437191 RepID=UPI001EAF3D18|nr:nucleolar complex protein 2 homolog isoform X1 [Osmia bicornis bicornis]
MKIKNMKSVPKKIKKPATKKRKPLNKVTTDEFFSQSFEDDIDDDDKYSNKVDENMDKEDANSSESDMDPMEHKRSLMKLKQTDPEFYSYLKENDKNLLEFNISDDDGVDNDGIDDDGVDDDDESLSNKLDKKHIPNDQLEVASDESDYEGDGDSGTKDKRKITLQLLKTWQSEIQKDKSLKTIKCAVEAFHAALQTVVDVTDPEIVHYKVEGGAVFNGVVQLCVLYLPNALKRYLKLDSESQFQVHKSKRFVKVKNILKSYLTDLIKILQNVTSSNIVTVLLKHLHQMLPYAQSFSSLTKILLRILLKYWTSGEETVRVVSFLCILRVATSNRESVLEMLYKAMYVKYVENSKFVSLTTLPGINFMRHSLVEIYSLDDNLAYNHAFLYIRQLAIHLRNAMTLKKKEHFQAVYNWQYINSLRFWCELINVSKSNSMLHSLLYPLVQIIIGTIKVIPTPQYYPLRFHCVQLLIDISRETDTFIPLLPFLLEILSSYDFNKRHKAVSMKPIPFICALRMSKSQLLENGFKDNVIDSIYKLILENAAKDSHKIYFPDLYIPCIIQLKAFLKKCHVANYCRKMKQLSEKIEENRKHIETERNKTVIDLKNMSQIKNWENKIKTEGTSLSKFYESYVKIHQSQKLKLLTKNDEIAEYNIPTIRKLKKGKSNEDSAEESDESSDFDLRIKTNEEKSEKPAKPKKKKKKLKVSKDTDNIDLPTENTDIVQDINFDDWS